MKSLLAFLLISLISVAKSDCDAYKFTICQNKFADSLGIDHGYNWQNPLGLTSQIQDIYINGGKNGARGINTVCNSYNSFIQCLSDSAFTAFECFDPVWLIQTDTSANKAYSYAFLFNMLQFQCGAGFYVASDNWSCLQKIYANKNATMFGCINDFVLNTQEDPDSGCQYVAKGMSCFEKASTYEKCPDELKYYGCESFRQYAAPRFGSCTDNKCYVDLRFR